MMRCCALTVLLGLDAIVAVVPAGAEPPVPYITVVAANPMEGLHVLAAQRDASFQVFLWRAHRYLSEQFKGASVDAIKKTLDDAGAVQIEEWGTDKESPLHVIRYLIQDKIIESKMGHAPRCLAEVRDSPKYGGPAHVDLIIVAEIGMDFYEAAAQRDYPKGTVLDRVFGLDDLQDRVKETSRLDKIEVCYCNIGFASSPDIGWGFCLEVSLSDPTGNSRLKEQDVSYFACSDLEPLSSYYLPPDERKAHMHVAHDSLIPGLGNHEHEKGYPDTFGSFGSGETRRSSP